MQIKQTDTHTHTLMSANLCTNIQTSMCLSISLTVWLTHMQTCTNTPSMYVSTLFLCCASWYFIQHHNVCCTVSLHAAAAADHTFTDRESEKALVIYMHYKGYVFSQETVLHQAINPWGTWGVGCAWSGYRNKKWGESFCCVHVPVFLC